MSAAGLDIVDGRRVPIGHAHFFGGLNLVGMNTGVVTARQTLGWPQSPASAPQGNRM